MVGLRHLKALVENEDRFVAERVKVGDTTALDFAAQNAPPIEQLQVGARARRQARG